MAELGEQGDVSAAVEVAVARRLNPQLPEHVGPLSVHVLEGGVPVPGGAHEGDLRRADLPLFVHRPETVGQLCSHANVDGAQSEKGRAARDMQCAWRAAAFDNVGSGELLFAGSTPGRALRERETLPFRRPS